MGEINIQSLLTVWNTDLKEMFSQREVSLKVAVGKGAGYIPVTQIESIWNEVGSEYLFSSLLWIDDKKATTIIRFDCLELRHKALNESAPLMWCMHWPEVGQQQQEIKKPTHISLAFDILG